MFQVKGKVALVTGGGAGIGLAVAEELLKEEARGVTIADISKDDGEKAAAKLKAKYGQDRVMFVHTDVSDRACCDNAFERTLEAFKNIDIVVNNAGVFNDRNYELSIAVNVTGAVNCLSLAMDKYLPKFKSSAEAVVLNTASEAGTCVYPYFPVYSATKSALISLTMSLGSKAFYSRNKVRIVAIAPGFTDTEMDITDKTFNELCDEYLKKDLGKYTYQPVEYVAKSMIEIIKNKPSGTVWMAVDAKELEEFIPALPTYEYEE